MRTATLRWLVTLGCVFAFHAAAPSVGTADEVLDWNAIAIRSMLAPGGPGGPLQARALAIVHAAIFDAVNGIDRRYTPIHVTEVAPRGASRRAAAIEAAFIALKALFPGQSSMLETDRAASLAAILEDAPLEEDQSIQRGLAWGEQVANAIVAWRNADGATAIMPPWLGGTEIGRWRPTPRTNPPAAELPGLPGAFLALATATPFVIPTPSHFRPAGPPALLSLEYAADVNEVKEIGAFTSATRTADQTQSARFWGGAAATVWNRAAVDSARAWNTSLSQNARLLALLNIAMTDTAITAWDAKAYFEFWRPITAIRLADLDGNDLTVEQTDWTPLLNTPPYPEYYSGHQSLSGSAYAVLTAFFGNDMAMSSYSEVFGPGVVRSWPNFRAAADEASDARIWAGIHFRFAMRDTRIAAEQVAAYVLSHCAVPLRGHGSQ